MSARKGNRASPRSPESRKRSLVMRYSPDRIMEVVTYADTYGLEMAMDKYDLTRETIMRYRQVCKKYDSVKEKVAEFQEASNDTTVQLAKTVRCSLDYLQKATKELPVNVQSFRAVTDLVTELSATFTVLAATEREINNYRIKARTENQEIAMKDRVIADELKAIAADEEMLVENLKSYSVETEIEEEQIEENIRIDESEESDEIL